MKEAIKGVSPTMARKQEYIDKQGVKWVTPARVAEIWNERALKERGVTSRYTRWSVFQRREKLTRMNTPGGDLYLESEVQIISLHPHPARPDVTEKNHKRSSNEFSKTSETDSLSS